MSFRARVFPLIKALARVKVRIRNTREIHTSIKTTAEGFGSAQGKSKAVEKFRPKQTGSQSGG